MTRDQIDELMRENGIVVVGEAVYALVQLVIEIERKECAKVCADIAMHRDVGAYGMLVAHSCANEILERGLA
jgi:hypothetical protein